MSESQALAAAIEAMVDRMVARRLEAALAGPGPAAGAPRAGRWMTPPKASKETGVAVRTIRAWANAGLVVKRNNNKSPDFKQEKYLVNADEVAAHAEGAGAPAGEDVVDAVDRIRGRAAAGRGGAR